MAWKHADQWHDLLWFYQSLNQPKRHGSSKLETALFVLKQKRVKQGTAHSPFLSLWTASVFHGPLTRLED